MEFRPGAGKVKVCEYCQTVVLRGEARLEALGKVAELVDTESPLKVGLSGRYNGTPFTVLGRIQKANATGTWDEWYLGFDDEREGWLAESEGEWKLLFPIAGVEAPPADSLAPLGKFTLRDKTFVVEERAHAETLSAEGQLPDFNRQHAYVDATGPKGVFATLDTADGHTEAFVGSFVTLKALGFDASELAPTPKREAMTAARCTNCNGPLDLKAPDATKRVACPYCGALLDVQYGTLSFLQLLDKPPYDPVIPLGAKGRLHEPTDEKPTGAAPEWTCLAFLIRSTTVEGTRYPWEEYLLWNHALGFRWLMNSNGHWTWLKPIPAGEVALDFRMARHGGTSYRGYQTVFATTEYVVGECYWTVSVGELAQASEFIEPPRSINLDLTDNEATFTLGAMVPAETIEKTFKLKTALLPATGIAPAQENPFAKKASEAWLFSGLWAGLLVVLMMAFAMTGTTETYLNQAFSVNPGATPGSPDSQRFSEPFEVKANVPLEVTVDAPNLSNNWLGVSVDLVNEKTNEVIAVYGEASYYSGYTDGESWSEGSRSETKTTDVVDQGTYVVRVTPLYEPGRAEDFRVKVSADDGPGAACPLFIFVLLLLAPIYYSVRSSSFETAKWNDAVFQSSPGVSSFPYAKDDE